MQGKTILLIVGGGIAAFKSLELLRELRRGDDIACLHNTLHPHSARASRPCLSAMRTVPRERLTRPSD